MPLRCVDRCNRLPKIASRGLETLDERGRRTKLPTYRDISDERYPRLDGSYVSSLTRTVTRALQASHAGFEAGMSDQSVITGVVLLPNFCHETHHCRGTHHTNRTLQKRTPPV